MATSKVSAAMAATRLLSTFTRKYSAAAGGAPHGGGMRQWKLVSLFVAMPAIGLCMFNAYINHEHFERPEFIPYEHLRIRNKRFPWGDGNKSLFHNKLTNALPDGYEELDDDHGHH